MIRLFRDIREASRVWVLCVKNAFLFDRRVKILGGRFLASESHFQDTLRSNRFSLGREKQTEVESTDSLAEMQCD
jgi:hypothetical protein